MDRHLMERAYSLAYHHYTAAARAVYSDLANEFPDAQFDTIHSASQRGMQLHLAALGFAARVWARSFSCERATEVLHKQFSDFPQDICDRAFSEAYRDSR